MEDLTDVDGGLPPDVESDAAATKQQVVPAIETKRLARTTLSAQLLDELRAGILSGRLPTNEPLPVERELCEAFGVGRTTVREALQGLLATGFVRRRSNRLVVVSHDEVDDENVDYSALASRLSVRDIYGTRKLIEVEIARLAAEHHTEEGLGELRALLERMDPDDAESYHALDEQFHVTVAGMCPNKLLVDIYLANRRMFFKLPAYFRVFRRPGSFPGGGKRGHQELYDAIASGDGVRASEVAWAHLDRVEQRLIERIPTSRQSGLQQQTDLSAPPRTTK